MTSSGVHLDADERIRGALTTSGLAIKEGKAVSLAGVSGCGYESVSVVGLGEAEKMKDGNAEIDEQEEIELKAERIRKAVAAGIKDVTGQT